MSLLSVLVLLALVFVLEARGHSLSRSTLIKSAESKSNAKVVDLSTPSSTIVASDSSTAADLPAGLKLLIGAGGIYAAFMKYGLFQEEIFSTTDKDGNKFKQVWFLQVLEAFANALVGGIGLKLSGGATPGLPLETFAMIGPAQLFAKACNSLALANGVSFPVVTLAKSGKMIPVMIGSILLGGSKYTMREYAQVGAIIAGTCMVSMGNKKKGGSSSMLGLSFIAGSLAFDGVVGGLQNRLKAKTKEVGVKPKPYDFMFWTNFMIMGSALIIALLNRELFSGAQFCLDNPEMGAKIVKFALCSAFGQSFIFYTLANFDSLVTTTVTTTRKIFSVLLSIYTKGHPMSNQGWAGIGLASMGILAEIQNKTKKKH